MATGKKVAKYSISRINAHRTYYSMADKLRVPPHSIETEESVLGSLLMDRDAVVAVVEFYGGAFYEENTGNIFSRYGAIERIDRYRDGGQKT